MRSFLHLFKAPSWATVSGVSSATVVFPIPGLTAAAKVTAPVISSNAYAIGTAGSCSYTFEPTGATIVSPGYGTASIDLPSGVIDAEIYNSNNAHLDSWGLYVDNYSIPLPTDYVDGTYKVVIHPKDSLREARYITISSGEIVSYPAFATRFGDLDNNSFVSSSEVSFVYGLQGSSNSDPVAWHLPVTGTAFTPSQADFNKDGLVNVSDYLLAFANLGTTGD
ncbi:MAG: hypothetical protein EOP06_01685 [Proteobacteria bacterium]|nr:MAG: hypothetical protein EOP06_01685 [Pseudomonadota bacterium]